MLLDYKEPNLSDFLVYDWYSVSIEICPDLFLHDYIFKSLHYEVCDVVPCSPRNGYQSAYQVVSDGGVYLTVYYGGASQKGKITVFASGVYSERFYDFIFNSGLVYSLVRCDIALDFNSAGAWLDNFNCLDLIGSEFSLKKLFVGPPDSERSDDVLDGRTFYLGSRTSPSFLRLYEKGKKDNPYFPNWVRLELEFKPKNQEARLFYARATKLEVLAASSFVAKVFSRTFEVGDVPCSPGTVRSLPSYERTLLHLFKQYGNFFEVGLSKHGGDFNAFYSEGVEMVDKFKKLS